MIEEAALDRILCESSTKSYGPLAVVSELYGDITVISKVPGTCFRSEAAYNICRYQICLLR